MSALKPLVTYYATLLAGQTRSNPSGLMRQIHDRDRRDEVLRADGKWHDTDFFVREEMRGSDGSEYEEITLDEAHAVIEDWRARGLIPPDAEDVKPPTPRP